MERLINKYDDYFMEIALPIISHDEYQKMKDIPHHNGSVYDHCLDVAYYAYCLSVKFGLDKASTIRGALLHDFYLYKFAKGKNKNLLSESFRHSKNHPKIAFQNAIKYFNLNRIEKDIITNHMFPVGLPKTSEAWATTFADKTLAVWEYSGRFRVFIQMKFKSYRASYENEF